MGYPKFLTDLFENGRVVAPKVAPISSKQLAEGDAVLTSFEREYRQELPSGVPKFEEPAGRWAARNFYLACQFAVYRDVPAAMIEKQLTGLPQSPITPAVHYSVDLVFRYLPDLAKFASSAAEEDPLVNHLRRWAREWPLSSVGMPEVGETTIDGFADNKGLVRLYADRIIATGDVSRLENHQILETVRACVGMYPQLAPKIEAALRKQEVEETSE